MKPGMSVKNNFCNLFPPPESLHNMQKRNIPFILFLLLLCFAWQFSCNLAFSVVPGWHTTIYPPYFFMSVAFYLSLLFVAFGYRALGKKGIVVKSKIYIAHILLILPSVLLITYPFLFLHFPAVNFPLTAGQAKFYAILLYTVHTIFILAQIVFAGYAYKRIKSAKPF